jgi:hypothetical protein
MAIEKRQSYNVDNRYSEARGVPDNRQALGFLNNYLQTGRAASRLRITEERRGDDRFIFGGQGGTLPLAALPYEPRGPASVGNTDRAVTFRNSFRTKPS